MNFLRVLRVKYLKQLYSKTIHPKYVKMSEAWKRRNRLYRIFNLITYLEVCNRYSSAITAFATVFLAILTAGYLRETKSQRELLQTQFVLSNIPDISIPAPLSFTYHPFMNTGAVIKNTGGPAEDVQLLFVIICCGIVDQLIKHLDETKVLDYKGHINRLPHNQQYVRAVGITTEQQEWLEKVTKYEEVVKYTEKAIIHAYVRVVYTKSLIASYGKEETVTDTSYFWWNPAFKQWMAHGKENHGFIDKIILSKGLLN